VIEQTVPLKELTAGMARCVREWILPHLADPMARIQAEQLIALLEGLPRMVTPAAAAAIRADSDEARAVLKHLGAAAPDAAPGDASVEALMEENAALKLSMETLAAGLRDGNDSQALAELQRFLVRSLTRELGGTVAAPDFAALTSRDREGKR
jgi:hypothetical protein